MTAIQILVPSLAALGALIAIFGLHGQARKHSNTRGTIHALFIFTGLLLFSLSIWPKSKFYTLFLIGSSLLFLFSYLINPRRTKEKLKGKYLAVAALAVAISGWLFTVNVVQNSSLSMSILLGRGMAPFFIFIVLMTFYLSATTWKIIAQSFVCGLLLMHVSGILSPSSWRECDIFKCGPFGSIYRGSFQTENSLALYTGLAIVVSWSAYAGWRRLVILLPLCLAMYASESRSAQIACGVALAVLFVFYSLRKFVGSNLGKIRSTNLSASTILLLTTLFSGIWLIIFSEDSAFSNRGRTWNMGMTALGDNWIAGLGIDRWVFYQTIGVVPPLFPHSQYLILLFGGGVVALFLYACFSFGILHSAVKDRSFPRFAIIISVFSYLSVIGLTEVFWNPIALDAGTSSIVILMAMTVSLSPRTAESPVDTGSGLSRVRR